MLDNLIPDIKEVRSRRALFLPENNSSQLDITSDQQKSTKKNECNKDMNEDNKARAEEIFWPPHEKSMEWRVF